MGSSARRKKERERRKQRQRRDRQLRQQREIQRSAEGSADPASRHAQRLLKQTPQAWPGEAKEDVAVFDDGVLSLMPPDVASQIASVRRALEAAIDSRGEDAINLTSTIPRSSPVSEWRLFVRGLVSWLASETQDAREAWKRLDPARRPGRIAIAMLAALRPDLDATTDIQAPREGRVDAEIPWEPLDEQLLYHAKLLRRTRIDRRALQFAKIGLEIPEESKDLKLGPKKIRWLRQFSQKHAVDEPDLVAALSQAALARAAAQKYSDLFDEAIRSLKGPRHDRRNLLLTFFYYQRFDNDAAKEKSQRALTQYLLSDLPQNQELTEPLRAAITSQIYLNVAQSLMRPADLGMFSFLFGGAEDSPEIRQNLEAAAQAYPSNREAYRTHAQWLESKLDDDRLTKTRRESFERELGRVMMNWSRGLPNDLEPRLWLVDFLLENERTEEAKSHVDWLAASRQDDPRVRATPWKWQLLEAMRLCRRKIWLSDVPARLDESERLWPGWLSRDWLPYLKASGLLRSGQSDAFEQARQRICEESGNSRDSLADACMMLGAAQRLRLPAEDLKPLRAPVDWALKNLASVSLETLLAVASFFWDLHRTQLVYPAYRLQGGKIGKELLSRLEHDPQQALGRANDGKLHAAILWCSEYRFWGDAYNIKLPSWYSSPTVNGHPMFSAAALNAFLKTRYHWRAENFKRFSDVLREAAPSQRDVYYRFWFQSLVEEWDDIQARRPSRGSGIDLDLFRNAFGLDADDEFDQDEFDLDDDEPMIFNPDCDCPRCQAAKRAYNARHRSAPRG